jgi:hypothetical protein
MAQIEIRNKYGKNTVTFDDIDISLVYCYTWHIVRKTRANYAATNIKRGKTVYMHQLILSTDNPLLEVDHIDGNGLNNCRNNLRLVTRKQNARNRNIINTNTGHKGVSYIESRRQYHATIWYNNRTISLGRFKDLEDAIKAYKFASKLYFGE